MAGLVLPREHGSWAMLLVPSLLGIFLSEPRWLHLFFILGWLFLYLSTTPLLNIIRNKRLRKTMLPWLFGYGACALLILFPVIYGVPEIVFFGVAVLPFLCGIIYFIRRRNERALMNDFCGISIFTIGGTAAYYLGVGGVTSGMFILYILTTFYFMGSAFYVKSLIRERNNPKFSRKSHVFHGLVLILPALIDWLLILPFIPGALKDWCTPRSKKIKPIHTGIAEIVNAVLFFFLVLMLKEIL